MAERADIKAAMEAAFATLQTLQSQVRRHLTDADARVTDAQILLTTLEDQATAQRDTVASELEVRSKVADAFDEITNAVNRAQAAIEELE